MRTLRILIPFCLFLAPQSAGAQAYDGLTADFYDREQDVEIVVIGRRPIRREDVDRNTELQSRSVPGDLSGEVTMFRPLWREGIFSVGGQVTSAPDQTLRYGPPPVTNRVPHAGLRIELNPIRDEERRRD